MLTLMLGYRSFCNVNVVVLGPLSCAVLLLLLLLLLYHLDLKRRSHRACRSVLKRVNASRCDATPRVRCKQGLTLPKQKRLQLLSKLSMSVVNVRSKGQRSTEEIIGSLNVKIYSVLHPDSQQ